MTDSQSDGVFDSIVDFRREFVKKGALAAGSVGLGLGSPSGVLAQDSGDQQASGGEAVMYNNEFHPGGQVRIISPVIEQTPNLAGLPQFSQRYNMRFAEYLLTGEDVLFYTAQDAQVEEGEVYALGTEITPFEDGAEEGLVTVTFEPVAGGDQYVDLVGAPSGDTAGNATDAQATDTPATETSTTGTPATGTPSGDAGNGDVLLEPDDDFGLVDGGGKALVRANNFYPGGLFQVVSDVVEWTPRPDVAGSDIFSEYNTRIGEYLGTSEQFDFYPAQAAAIDTGGVYVMRDEFDITDPEGNLVTVDVDRVDETDLDTDLYDEGLR
ncbi:hypothetical protein ACFR9U_20900 [Halorientalis brevis]|uniref:Twin-arginine translocation signal domain-containing protein n=1 Tax=Halorientalis brevis TaxID=1126241 RepID=A0ABD6CGJ6_9EURY|nr:hypothetical protein [Halorientalis brevis]